MIVQQFCARLYGCGNCAGFSREDPFGILLENTWGLCCALSSEQCLPHRLVLLRHYKRMHFLRKPSSRYVLVLFASTKVPASVSSLELHKEPTAGDWYISIPHLWKRNSEHRLLPAFPNWTPSVPLRRVIKSTRHMRAANADPFRMGFVWVCWACWVILCHHLSGMEPPAAVSYTGTHGNRVLALNNLNLTSWCPCGWLLWAWWCAGTKFEVALDAKYLFVL